MTLSPVALEQVLKYAVPRRCMTSKGGTAYGWFAAESGLNWDRSNAMILASGNIPVEVRNELDVMAIAKIIFPVEQWHQLSNPYTRPCQIIEIQYGDQCVEEDIERKE